MDNELLINQLLARGLSQPYIAVEVLGKNLSTLFKQNLKARTLAKVIFKYYQSTSDVLTNDVFRTMVQKEVEKLVKTGRLSESDETSYYNYADLILDTQVDTSEKMSDMINKSIRDNLAKQAMLQIASKTASEAEDFDIVKSVNDEFNRIGNLDITGQGDNGISVYTDYEKDHEEFLKLGSEKIKMGLQPFDEALTGGLSRGEVALLGAVSGGGKTTSMINIAINYTKQGYNVMYFSLEEKASEMLLRFARVSLGLDIQNLLSPKGDLKPNMEKVIYDRFKKAQETGKLGDLYYKQYYPRTLTVDGLRQAVKSREQATGIKYDVVVVDYPDLMANSYQTTNESKDGGMLFQDLRRLAQENEFLLWTATQLNRSALGQDLKSLAYIEGSAQKINTVEFAITLNVNDDEREEGYQRFYIDKLRNRYAFDGNFLYLKYKKYTSQIVQHTPESLEDHQYLINKKTENKKQQYRDKKEEEQIKENAKKRDSVNEMFGI